MAPTARAPDTLTTLAEDRFRAVKAQLAGRRVNDSELRSYCQVWARWRQAEDGIALSGQLVKNAAGRAVASPLLRIAHQALREVRALEKSLGLVDAGAGSVDDDDRLLTRRELAKALDKHMMTVTKWERDGLPVARRGRKGKPSLYREADVRAWVAAREDAAARGTTVDVAAERARKERAQATLAEQSYAMRARLLLPADEVDRIWSAETTAVRNKLLAVPATSADLIHRAGITSGVAGVMRALEKIVHDILTELADPNRPIGGNGNGHV